MVMGITTILMPITLNMIGFQGSLPQSSSHASAYEKANGNLYGKYLISNPVNASDQLSNMFTTWIGDNTLDSHMPSQSQEKRLFQIFLDQNPCALKLLNQITASENAKFQMENHEAGFRFMQYIRGTSKLPHLYEFSAKNSGYVAIRIVPPLYPQGFPTCMGEYVMVSMNYYSLPWWLGSLHYGEYDIINILFVGSSAQPWYNNEYNTIQNFQTYSGVLGLFIAGLTSRGAYYRIASVTSAIAAEIFGIIAATGIGISMIQGYMGNQLHQMYDSTYANPINGEPKFLWMFYSITYIYVGVGSSFAWNGYTNTGTVSILPYIPVVSNNTAFIVVAGALSCEAHDITGKIGWNSWGTVS